MNFKKLGNTNIQVSTICLGTMTWGEQNTQKDAFEQMDYAIDQGINFFDTAEIYSVPTKSETILDLVSSVVISYSLFDFKTIISYNYI